MPKNFNRTRLVDRLIRKDMEIELIRKKKRCKKSKRIKHQILQFKLKETNKNESYYI